MEGKFLLVRNPRSAALREGDDFPMLGCPIALPGCTLRRRRADWHADRATHRCREEQAGRRAGLRWPGKVSEDAASVANVHYAKIGDVWKHLPLSEVLRIEVPRRYLESHAGSASYPLTPSAERSYGVLHFLSEAARSPVLDASVYRRLLRGFGEGGVPKIYPGSPLIAMTLLGSKDGYAQGEQFVFCDLDGTSLSTISEDAHELGLPEDHLRLVEGDGIATLGRELEKLSKEEAAATFLHLDPYHPLEAGDDGATSLDLLGRATTLGTKCMLWYGFDSRRRRDEMFGVLTSCEAAMRDEAGDHRRLWFGEVSLSRWATWPSSGSSSSRRSTCSRSWAARRSSPGSPSCRWSPPSPSRAPTSPTSCSACSINPRRSGIPSG